MGLILDDLTSNIMEIIFYIFLVQKVIFTAIKKTRTINGHFMKLSYATRTVNRYLGTWKDKSLEA